MRLLLVDGHYYLYRSFFAIRGLTNSRGEPTNAIYGFAKALRKMIADVKPDRAAVIWDCGLPERRTTLQPEYKQNRPSMPDEMRSQETWLQKNVSLFGPASLCLPNTEADDLIASYAFAAVREGAEVVVATNDKDILQIVSPSIHIYSTNKTDAGTAGFALLGEDEVRVKWGVDPARIAEVLALTGDTSDNIPGVPGVGEKTAAQLVREFGTVNDLLARAAQIKSDKVREKILAARDLILANRQMVALDEDLPLPRPVLELGIRPDYPALIEAVKGCEFKSLLKEIEAEAEARTVPAQGELL
jgi:5'-3' exonuclease